MADIGLYLELPCSTQPEDAAVLAHVLILPGCSFEGPDARLCLKRAPGAIAEYVRWCQGHSERISMPRGNVAIAEQAMAEFVGERLVHPCFAPDEVPIAADEVRVWMRRFLWAIDDLWAQVAEAGVLGHNATPGALELQARLRELQERALIDLGYLHIAVPMKDGATRLRDWANAVHDAVLGHLGDGLLANTAAGERFTLRKVLRQLIGAPRAALFELEKEIVMGRYS